MRPSTAGLTRPLKNLKVFAAANPPVSRPKRRTPGRCGEGAFGRGTPAQRARRVLQNFAAEAKARRRKKHEER